MSNDIEYEAALDAHREWVEQGAAEAEAEAQDGHYGGYVIVGGEKWWSEETLRAAEERARRAAQEERATIVKWLRESVGSGPADVIADQISLGYHRGEGDPNHCPGKLRNGPDKRYARCEHCHRIDYEGNEGDRCTRPLGEAWS